MKKTIIILFSIITSFSVQAQKQNGEVIKAKDFSSSVFNIGAIQQSLLPTVKFQQINGDCWVKMAGQNIANSDYALLTGDNVLPNSAGMFLRDIGNESAPL